MKSNYKIEPLGEHVKQFSLRNKDEADIEVYSVTNSAGFTLSTDYFSKEVFSKDVSNYKIVSRDQFAYNPSRINVGSIDYLRNKDKVLVSPLYIIFETDSKLSEDYLLRFLKSDWGNIQIRANTEGAVRDSLKFKGLEKIQIPLPPIDDQKRIAHLLGKVEGMIARRKQHLQQLDELLKSVFLEMFGDHFTQGNYKSFGEYIDVLTDYHANGSYEILRDHVELQTTPDFALMVRTTDLENKNFVDGCNYITEKAYEFLSKSKVYGGEIIINKIGSAGRVYLMPFLNRPVSLGMNAFLLRFNNKLNNIYMYYLLTSDFGTNAIQKHVKGAVTKTITKNAIRSIKIPVPPITLQNQFASIVSKVESLKSRYQSSLSNLENLYGALSQKAFKGELDLGRVPLPVVEEAEKPEDVPVLPFDEGLSETMKKTLADLNKFNNSSASLRALQEAMAINLDSPTMKAAQMLAEQARLWKNPLDELKNMSSVSRAMAELAKLSTLPQMTVEQLEAFRSTSRLAQQLAASLPKIDMRFIEQQKKLLENASRPFMEMQKTLANLNLSHTTLSGTLDDSEAVARRFQAAIPDFSSWQQQYRTPENIDTDEEDEEPKHIFTRYDITDILTDKTGLSFEELSKKLSELERIDLSSYERIRSILFEMLREEVLTQQFDAESQSLQLRLTK
ncbi:MAG: restriction endonuclease subunit S [SAR324 cluster bacterium]|nr:restriction endonuclease subunit S [SAR324 cluster bacterium]